MPTTKATTSTTVSGSTTTTARTPTTVATTSTIIAEVSTTLYTTSTTAPRTTTTKAITSTTVAEISTAVVTISSTKATTSTTVASSSSTVAKPSTTVAILSTTVATQSTIVAIKSTAVAEMSTREVTTSKTSGRVSTTVVTASTAETIGIYTTKISETTKIISTTKNDPTTSTVQATQMISTTKMVSTMTDASSDSSVLTTSYEIITWKISAFLEATLEKNDDCVDSDFCESSKEILSEILSVGGFEEIRLLEVTQIEFQKLNFQIALDFSGPSTFLMQRLDDAFSGCEINQICKNKAEINFYPGSFTEESVEILEKYEEHSYFIWRIDSFLMTTSEFQSKIEGQSCSYDFLTPECFFCDVKSDLENIFRENFDLMIAEPTNFENEKITFRLEFRSHETEKEQIQEKFMSRLENMKSEIFEPQTESPMILGVLRKFSTAFYQTWSIRDFVQTE